MERIWIRNVRLILPEGIRTGSLLMEDGRIAALDPEAAEDACVVDGKGCYLAPGLIELHTHGAGGSDFMDGTLRDILAASRMHLRHGVTTLMPTTLASSMEELFATVELFRQAQNVTEGMPYLHGLHLEGPYFSMAQRGAQDPAYIKNPDPAEYMRVLERAQGAITRWSVAPELPGAMEMGDVLVRHGVLPSIAHSDAQLDQVKEAMRHGYTHVTHLYSGMSTITRERGFRKLGVLESAYVLDELTVEVIADGCHLPPELLRLVWQVKGRENTCLVTDSMRCAGETVAESIVGSRKNGQRVIIEDGVAKLPDRSAFASSIASADDLLRVMWQKAGIPLEDCVYMMTAAPARIMKLDDRKGALQPGYDADVVLMDEQLHPLAVYVMGKKQFEA